MGGTRWDVALRNHLESETGPEPMNILPFSGADQIKVTFSEDVMVGSGDLRVYGRNVRQYSILEFTYDVDQRTAVWTLAQSVGADTLSVRLFGVTDLAGNALDGDTDGDAGGRFRHQFSVLPGDVDGDGRVDGADYALARTHVPLEINDVAYALASDIDGDGRIDDSDLEAIEGRAGTTVPNYRAPVAGDSNGDGRFDEADLILVMQGGKYRSGELATWREGDWNRDGLFDEADLIWAFQAGTYESERAALDAVFEELGQGWRAAW